MRTYRVTGGISVLDWEPGDSFEHDFTAEAEAILLRTGRIEIVPRAYRVVGSRRVFETGPDGQFVAALTITQEQQLVAGGHIELIEPKAKAERKSSKAPEAEFKKKEMER